MVHGLPAPDVVRVDEAAVGDAGEALGRLDADVVRRLVRGMVAGGEPGGGGVGFAGDEDTVVGLHPAVVGAEDDGAVERLGDAAVGDRDGERAVVADRVARGDAYLVAGARELGASAVHFDGGDGQLLEVQVEGGEVLGGPRGDGGDAVEAVGRGVVRHVQVVVGGVEAAVAELWEVRVADAVRAGVGAGAAAIRQNEAAAVATAARRAERESAMSRPFARVPM